MPAHSHPPRRVPDASDPGARGPVGGARRVARAGRVAWTLTSFVVVQMAVCGLAVLPVVLLARAILELPGGWPRWIAAAVAVVPAFAIVAILLMACSAAANRLLGWRTPPHLDLPLADLEWPLLIWVRYVAAMRLVNVVAGRLFCGSPIWTTYLRLNGARIGRRTYVNSTSLSDHNLLDVGDDVVIGADAHISGHTIEHGRLKTGTVRIGRGATVGIGSIVGIDVEVGAGTVIGALSLVPKRSRLDAGAVYVGIPVRRLES